MIHSNTNQQQALISLHQPSVNGTVPPHPSITNPTESSTPISASSKRGRNDTSDISETNIQLRPQYPQSIRIFNASNMSNKRPRRVNQQTSDSIYSNQYGQNQPV
jgi:hypothetical protein